MGVGFKVVGFKVVGLGVGFNVGNCVGNTNVGTLFAVSKHDVSLVGIKFSQISSQYFGHSISISQLHGSPHKSMQKYKKKKSNKNKTNK